MDEARASSPLPSPPLRGTGVWPLNSSSDGVEQGGVQWQVGFSGALMWGGAWAEWPKMGAQSRGPQFIAHLIAQIVGAGAFGSFVRSPAWIFESLGFAFRSVGLVRGEEQKCVGRDSQGRCLLV